MCEESKSVLVRGVDAKMSWDSLAIKRQGVGVVDLMEKDVKNR